MKRTFFMPILLLAATLFGAGQAYAQACEPAQGVGAKLSNDGANIVATYWCPPAARWLDYTGQWGALSLAAPAAVQAQVIAALKTGKASDLRALITSTTMPASARAQLLATRPPAPVIVAKNGTSTTRPTYIVTGGKRAAAAATARATVGARAACGVVMVVEGSSVYCSWERTEGGPYTDIVTLVAEVK